MLDITFDNNDDFLQHLKETVTMFETGEVKVNLHSNIIRVNRELSFQETTKLKNIGAKVSKCS